MTHTPRLTYWIRSLVFPVFLASFMPYLPPTAMAGEPGPASMRSSTPPAPTSEREILSPQIIDGPPVRPGAIPSEEQLALLRQFQAVGNRILSPGWTDQGYIHSSWLGHWVIGPGEEVLTSLTLSPPPKASFMVFRPIFDLVDPLTQEAMGTVAYNLGLAQLNGGKTGSLFHGQILNARREIEVGDRLLAAGSHSTDWHKAPTQPPTMKGRILHIIDNLEMAGDHQVVVVGIGRREQASLGMNLTINQQRRLVLFVDGTDTTERDYPTLPHTIGMATLFHIGEKASYALLSHTTQPVRRGDEVYYHP